ncbi:lysis system i-spanin subunit Rz [Ewingella americana]|uniref:lysis system i-spanin subunit Rz n=1 Tax=Ewingella americana TaxID=41202 RepID=UPI00163B1F8C|nr:lysis system i-spanin subunit Rz [Ewingella americana]QMV54091.1 lysis protein [Ewingella americana]
MNVKALVIVAALLAAGVTWWIEGVRWDKDVASLNESHERALKKVSDKAFADLAAANQRTAEAQAAAAELDKKHTEELANELAKNEALRADVAAGTRRVRIASANLATCQLTRGNNTGAGGVGDAAQVELSSAGGRAVLDLRASAIKDNQVIQYLQGYITDVVKQCKIR